MRITGIPRRAAIAAAAVALLAGCGGSSGGDAVTRPAHSASPAADPTRVPGLGDRLQQKIPDDSRQVLAVYGSGRDAADATVVLYTKDGRNWERTRDWAGHNGKRGWTTDHHENDKRSPVGVFTLSDAGGVLADPGAKLPYTRSDGSAAPRTWSKSHWHDFDHVIAIDYNRVRGTPPNDPNRPEGQEKGGYIWLHLDHGSGTSGCVSLPKAGMQYLLRTLDPELRPVVVMGDRASLAA
ncbi:MAG TPA: hypothetical protein DEQ61_12755 [Streptomyces sp.]|nr:hypothetical protein [Streptomyces sp.]